MLKQLAATDIDSGVFGEVRYSIQSVTGPGVRPESKFTVDAVSGLVTTAGAMLSDESYVIIVQACDQAPISTRRLVE